MLSVKQRGIKYHFLSLGYDSTWDWTQVSRATGKHANHYANVIAVIMHALCSLLLIQIVLFCTIKVIKLFNKLENKIK